MELPVMILPNATLFPQAMLPLYIFEPRYKRLLADALDGHRMLAVACQRPDRKRETPSRVAGVGLIRIAVRHGNDTSHLILHGLARVELAEAVAYRPYRRHRIRPLTSPTPANQVVIQPLVAHVKALVTQRLNQGAQPDKHSCSQLPVKEWGTEASPASQMIGFLSQLDHPEQVADLVSCTLIAKASERQALLETVDLQERLQLLIFFLLGQKEA